MEQNEPPARPVPLLIVVARILIISGMSFAAAGAIFFFLGGVWQVGLPAVIVCAVLLGLMFLVERAAA